MTIGEPFNPWRDACGFYAPDELTRLGALVIIATHRKLSHGHKLLYVLLVRRWGRRGPCFPGQAALARTLGVSERTVRMWIEDLEAFGLILRRSRGRAKGGCGQTDEYIFLWHPIFDRRIRSLSTGKKAGFDRQESAVLTGKNGLRLYSEETRSGEARTTEAQQASRPTRNSLKSSNAR